MLVTAVALATVVRAQTAALISAEPIPTDIAALTRTLTDSTAKQDLRDQAAERLLSRPDPAARTAIVDALTQFGQPGVQLAAARALAGLPTADPKLINVLFPLLDSSSTEALIDSAAHALTAFKSDDNVMLRLLGLARDGNDERVRVAAIHAASTFVDLRVGQTLIDLLDSGIAGPKVNAAAADGLGYFSGLDAAQTTPDGWRAWWNNNRGKSAVQFRADIELSRSKLYDRNQAAVVDLQGEFLRVLSDQYQRLPKDQRADALVRYLKSPEAAVRVVGCRIARQGAENAEVPQASVREQLRQLIGDASPAVRAASAEALALINDPTAFTAILTQLNQETDATARASLIKALRPIGDVRATPILLSMLDDPSTDVAEAAAEDLAERDFGQKLRQADPNLAEIAAQKLMDTLKNRTTPHDDNGLRYALLRAIVPLQSRSLERAFAQMASQPIEVPRVRREVLNALGEMHDPQLADTIASSLGDPDTTVKLAAVKALGNSGISLGTYDKPLSDLINPNNNVSQDLRDAAWGVLKGLFVKAQADQLPNWETKPGVKEDPLKLLVIYKEERARARAAGDDDTAAFKNQQIGDKYAEALMWPDAIAAYNDALAYAQQAHKSYMIETVSDGLTKAYLKYHQYDSAINFVQRQIKFDPSLEGTLGPDIRQEAERLVDDNKDYDASLQLIDLAMKMDPPLKPQSKQRLEELRSQVQRRSHEQNLTPYPSVDGTQTAMAY